MPSACEDNPIFKPYLLELEKSNCSLQKPQNICLPRLAFENKAQFRSSNCCDHSQYDHLYKTNCCCTAYWHVATDETYDLRKATHASLLVAYGLALLVLCYRIWVSYRVSPRSTGGAVQSISDFLRSRKFVLNFSSFAAVIFGICSATFQTRAFNCYGGRDDRAGCVVGRSSPGVLDLYSFVTFDVLANIFFIIAKIMILQKCLRAVLLVPQSDGLNRRILPGSVALLFLCLLSWAVCALVNYYYGTRVAADASSNSVSSERLLDSGFLKEDSNSQTQRFGVRAVVYILAGVTFITATLSSLLHVYLTSFHLKRYIRLLLQDGPQCDVAEASDTELSVEPSSIRGYKGKHYRKIRRNLRRLNLAVVIIACSFVVKAVLYISLSIGYSDDDDDLQESFQNITADACARTSNLKTVQQYFQFALCDQHFTRDGLVWARTILGSPLVFPLISLFSDPLLMMCVSNPNPTPKSKAQTSFNRKSSSTRNCS